MTDRNIPTKEPSVADKMKVLAYGAILDGPGSQNWSDYMKMIIGNNAPKQLKRLTLQEPVQDPEIRRSAAYMIANAICTPDTTTRTGLGVNLNVLDKPLP